MCAFRIFPNVASATVNGIGPDMNVLHRSYFAWAGCMSLYGHLEMLAFGLHQRDPSPVVDGDLLGPSIHYTLELDVPPEALEVLEE